MTFLDENFIAISQRKSCWFFDDVIGTESWTFLSLSESSKSNVTSLAAPPLGLNVTEPGGQSGKPPASPLAVQIEVDIEPPPSGGLTDEKLEKLGLPTHHLHFTAAAAQQVGQQLTSTGTTPIEGLTSTAILSHEPFRTMIIDIKSSSVISNKVIAAP